MALPLAVLEITDTQVCTVLTTRGNSAHPLSYSSPCSPRSRVHAAPTLRLAQVTVQESTPLSSIHKTDQQEISETLVIWLEGRSRSITFENCTANDYSTTFGLEPSAVAT